MMRKQSGLTLITWAIIISLVGVQLIFAMRIIPVYLDFATVKSIMNDVQQNPEFANKTPRDIMKYVRTTLQLNNITHIQKQAGAFKFKKQTDGLHLQVNYEDRGPIIGNLDFIAKFEYQIVIPRGKSFE